MRSRQKSRERSLSGATKRIRGGFEEDRIALFTVVFFDLPGLPAVLLILEVLRKLYPAGSYAGVARSVATMNPRASTLPIVAVFCVEIIFRVPSFVCVHL